MITKEQIDRVWQEYYDFRHNEFGGPGNGYDDCRDCSAEVLAKMTQLYKVAIELQKEYDKSHYLLQ